MIFPLTFFLCVLHFVSVPDLETTVFLKQSSDHRIDNEPNYVFPLSLWSNRFSTSAQLSSCYISRTVLSCVASHGDVQNKTTYDLETFEAILIVLSVLNKILIMYQLSK